MTKTKISTLAVDLAKGSSQVCAVESGGAVPSDGAMSRTRLALLLAEQPVSWWRSKRARRRISGGGSRKRMAMRFGSCQRLT